MHSIDVHRLIAGSGRIRVAIILVHYGVMFLLAMWLITLSRKALTITAITWLVAAPCSMGFQQSYAITGWWHDNLCSRVAPVDATDALRCGIKPLLTLWMCYSPAIIRYFIWLCSGGHGDWATNLKKLSTGLFLFASGVVTYLLCRGVARWLLTDEKLVARIAHGTGVAPGDVSIYAATGSAMDTNLIMGTPQWFGLAVPHSGAPLDIYSTAGAAIAAIGFFVLVSRSRIVSKVLFPLTATGTIALTAYTAHISLRGYGPRDGRSPCSGDPAWAEIWLMLLRTGAWSSVLA